MLTNILIIITFDMLLIIPNANLSYTIQPESYSLMNAMEFMNDEYASWDVTYYLNGFLPTNCAKSYLVNKAENSALESSEKNKLLLFKESK